MRPTRTYSLTPAGIVAFGLACGVAAASQAAAILSTLL